MKVSTFIIVALVFINTSFGQNRVESIDKKQAIVFIAGFDEGDNQYYANARNYFSNKHYQVIDNAYTLRAILNWLQNHYDAQIYGDIHIVSHSNPWRGLSLKIEENGERISEVSLSQALENKKIIPLVSRIIPANTNIIFHSCGLGENTDLLKLLKKSITANTNTKLYVSSHFNVFGGKYVAHYLAKTYYGYYPTAQSPGPRALANEFKKSYPNVQANWENVLKTRTEQLAGELYTYKFNIPVEWEFTFSDKKEIPKFSSKDEIMDWILENDELAKVLYQFNIPIEKFRWMTRIKKNKLIIKGKTTVLCVMQPIMASDEKYMEANFKNRNYYNEF